LVAGSGLHSITSSAKADSGGGYPTSEGAMKRQGENAVPLDVRVVSEKSGKSALIVVIVCMTRSSESWES